MVRTTDLIQSFYHMSFYDGKVVLIVGASEGLGLALVKHLATCSTARVIATSRSVAKIQKRMGELSYGNVTCASLDLEHDDERIQADVNRIIGPEGKVDILINCAGMGFRGVVLETSMPVHRRVFQVDYFGQVAVIKAVLSSWSRGAYTGHIIQVSSVQGYFGLGERAPYSAAKHALVGFIDSLRTECDSYPEAGGNRVTLVCPGYINTNHGANALTSDGSAYQRTDEATVSGYSPEYVADQLLFRSARGEREIVIADAKVRILIKLRSLCSGLCFRMLRIRLTGKKQSFFKTVLHWLFSS